MDTGIPKAPTESGNRMPVLTLATYNPHHSRPTAEIRIDVLKLISAGADVICLQEMNGHYPAIYPLPRQWAAHIVEPTRGEPGGRGECPILYNADKINLLASGYRWVNAPQSVEDGAGGKDVAEKTVTWIKITVGESRKPIAVLNVHAIASVEKGGKPNPDVPLRLKVFSSLMYVLRDMAKRRIKLGQSVIVAGDLNVDYDRDLAEQDPRFPYSVLDGIGIHASYTELGTVNGTHGGRVIDYICGSAKLRAVEQQALTGYGSDHKPVLVTYEIAQ